MKIFKWILVLAMAGVTAQAAVTKASFGTMPDGSAVDVYTLKSAKVEARVITYGAKLISVKSADRSGKMADVVLGYDTLDGYMQDAGGTYFGSIVGRYGNRIAKGRFALNGTTYQIPTNNNGNALHGGTKGFDQAMWSAHETPNGVELTLVSKDGEMGFPRHDDGACALHAVGGGAAHRLQRDDR